MTKNQVHPFQTRVTFPSHTYTYSAADQNIHMTFCHSNLNLHVFVPVTYLGSDLNFLLSCSFFPVMLLCSVSVKVLRLGKFCHAVTVAACNRAKNNRPTLSRSYKGSLFPFE